MNRMPTACPICGSQMHATEIRCDECETTIRSQFEPCRFCYITPEQIDFVIHYLRFQGDIDDIANALNIPHQKVTRKLEQTLTALEILDHDPGIRALSAPPVRDQDLRSILDLLDNGDISAEEATRKLKDL